jgi:DNA-binding GntR family transcriptional regulator
MLKVKFFVHLVYGPKVNGVNALKNSLDRDAFKVPESLSQTVYNYLEKEIVEGRLEAGTRLIPEDFARMLQVSKSPVREALQTLHKEGFVTSKPRGGFFVAEIRIEDIEEIYPIRAALNRVAFRTIVENEYKPDFISTLEDILKKMEQRVQEDNVKEYFYLNVKLYNFLLERCPNRRVSKMLNQLGKQVLRFRFMSMSNPGHIKRSLDGHKRLIKALKEKDVEASMRIAEGIIYSALDVLRQILEGKNVAKNKEDYV